MLSKQDFIKISIETNLFFNRIMKEHLFFIETNLQPVEIDLIAEARMLKQGFEQLLAETIYYANHVVSKDVLISNEIVTPYTLHAEELTKKLTGADINTDITKLEMQLKSNQGNHYADELENIINNLNNNSLYLLNQTISFQKRLESLLEDCKIFITLYYEMLKHNTREAEYYLELLSSLQKKTLPNATLCNELNFWNHIMEEHAQFINGMLDPTEKELKEIVETTANKYERLVQECIRIAENQIIDRSFNSTKEFKHFKQTSVEGILNCQVKSIIPPLLADHVLREANYYLRLLELIKGYQKSL